MTSRCSAYRVGLLRPKGDLAHSRGVGAGSAANVRLYLRTLIPEGANPASSPTVPTCTACSPPIPCSASLGRRSGDPRSPSTNSQRSNGSSGRSRSPCAGRYSRSSTARGSKGASRSLSRGPTCGTLAGDQRGREQDARPAPGRQRPLGMAHRRGLRAAFEYPWSVLAVGGGSRALAGAGGGSGAKTSQI